MKIRPRRNSTPYKGGGNRKTSTHQRTPNRERVSRDSDIARAYSGGVHNESPVHLSMSNIESRQKTPPIREEEIEINLLQDEGGTNSTHRQSDTIEGVPLEKSSDILVENAKEVEIKSSVSINVPGVVGTSRNREDTGTPVLISSTD